MSSQVKKYKNKNLGDFHSIPISLVNESKIQDSLYLASNFKKLATKPVATVRASKHYASTLAAWEKKLTGVDTEDLSRVAETLGYDVEVFNPLASSEPRTLVSGGGRSSKRKAQLLKVKKGVYKPMMAGAIIDELPPDMMRDVVGRLDPKDKSALLDVSRGVREDTMAALPPQELLWAAARTLNIEDTKRALEEGARINKIDPSVGMNALKMIKGRTGSEALYAFLERKGGIPLTFEQINKHLVRCVKAMVNIVDFDPDDKSDSDEYYPYEKEDYYYFDPDGTWAREALLDGADANTRAVIERGIEHVSINADVECGLLHLLTVNAMDTDNPGYISMIVDTIKLLSSFGIDMNQVDVNHDKGSPSGQTALHYACHAAEDERDQDPLAGNRPAIVKALLESGINVNGQDSRGETALHRLANYPSKEPSLQQEEVSLARLLLSFGADVSIKNNSEQTVIDYTEEEDFVTYDPVMLDVLMRATETREDFIQAVKDGNVESVKQFLQQGAPVNTSMLVSYMTPLHLASIRGNTETVRALLAVRNINVNGQDVSGRTPLHMAGNTEIVQALLTAPDIGYNMVDKKEQTPLHLASYEGNTQIVRLLLAVRNISVNDQDEDGRTPLHLASIAGNTEIVQALLAAPDIDVNIRDVDEETPLQIAYHLPSNTEIVRLLREAESRQRVSTRDRKNEDDDEGSRSSETRSRDESDYDSDRSVRQRVGGRRGGSLEAANSNVQSRSSRYGKERTNDAALAQAITVLFSKMKSIKIKNDLLAGL